MVEIYEDRPQLTEADLERLEPRRRLILMFTGDAAVLAQCDLLETLAREMRAVIQAKTDPPLNIKRRMMRCSGLVRAAQKQELQPMWEREKWAIVDEKALKKTPPPREPSEYVPATSRDRINVLNQYPVFRR